MANPERKTREPTAGRGRGHGRPTLATVATAAGVTAMTVSRYLRGRDAVAPATAARIDAALTSTGYTPNKHAGMLASGRSNIVAAIVPSIANSNFSVTLQGLSHALQHAGMELLLASTDYSLAREEQQLRAVLGWSPSGLVVTGCRHSPASRALMRRAQATGMPVLEMWDHNPRDKQFVQVGFGHAAVGRMMAQHLLQRGYRDLGYVDSGVAQDFRAHQRASGFAAAARAAGVPCRLFAAPQIEAMAAGRDAFATVAQAALPRALAFASDNLAAGALLCARGAGLRIPTQLAFLGFGDQPVAAQLGLSTVSVAPYQIGAICGQRLLRMLVDGGVRSGTVQTDESSTSLSAPALLQRDSS
ncbi:MAG: LacI family DNA-binding transcriptional regulator [Rubrivivax sp.]